MIILPRGEYLVWALSVPPISGQSNGPLKARIRPLSHNHPEAHRTAKQFLQSTSCEKCKGSGLFYGPLAEGGSMYGLGRVWLINVWRAVPVAGQSVNPRHILFIFCFPSPIFYCEVWCGDWEPYLSPTSYPNPVLWILSLPYRWHPAHRLCLQGITESEITYSPRCPSF